MGRDRHTRRQFAVDPPWLQLSVRFLRSKAFAQLSPHAVKLLFDLMAQLKAEARGNGDLCAAPAVMKPRGWVSKATLQAAIKELIAAHLLVVTRRGGQHVPHLFAITLWPMNCDAKKLHHGPGSYSTEDWKKAGVEEPTSEKPASWSAVRKSKPRQIALPTPATGPIGSQSPPPRAQPPTAKTPIAPATGPLKPVSVE